MWRPQPPGAKRAAKHSATGFAVEEARVALPILRVDAAALAGRLVVQTDGALVELLDDAAATRVPVVALHQHDQIVSADMTHEVAKRIASWTRRSTNVSLGRPMPPGRSCHLA